MCTITVNSDNEREVLKSTLPPGDFNFVELVERGRPDWLASACKQKVQCDVLVISGHFDGGTEFYTDRLDDREYLPVHEMERVACSESCPGLFSKLKEVYLFGCNTLNNQAMRSASAEVARSLVRAGHAPADAEALAQVLADRHGESNRDRMRHIFKDVPVIYGFPNKAPLGRYAGPLLEKYLRSGGEFSTGRASPRLLATFGASAMTATAGITDGDARAGFRRDVCKFSDDRLSEPAKVGFMHEVLGRDMAEVRMFLDHLERYSATLPPAGAASATTAALDTVASDGAARARYLEFAADADDPAVRVRMLALAQRWGWITGAQERRLVADMIGERLAATGAGVADVDLACSLNKDGSLDAELARLVAASPSQATATRSAVLACLGSGKDRDGVLRAWSGESADDVVIAQAYLAHRPVEDAAELLRVTHDVSRMRVTLAQVRALDALARHRVEDPETLLVLARVFGAARSVDVQRAVANVMLRGNFAAIASAELVAELRKKRLRGEGDEVADALLRRLDAARLLRADVPRAALEPR